MREGEGPSATSVALVALKGGCDCTCEQEYWATSRAVSLVWWRQQPGCRGSRERIDVRKWPL